WVLSHEGIQERGVAIVVAGAGVGSAGQKNCDGFQIAKSGSSMERCGSVLLAQIDLRSVNEQDFHHVHIFALDSHLQWSSFVEALRVRIRTVVKQELNNFNVAPLRRAVQGRKSLVVAGLDVCVSAKQEFHHGFIIQVSRQIERSYSNLV